MAYVDGFLTPVPKKKLAAYQRVSEKMGRILRELGALEFRECVADDVKWGKRTSFPRAVKQRAGETVFCYAADVEPVIAALRGQHELAYLHRPANLEDLFLKLTGRDLRD